MADTSAFAKWLFSRQSKRMLLEAVIRDPGRTWSRKELARACGQHEKARMDLHLDPLLAAGVLRRTGDGYHLVADEPLVGRIRDLLDAL